jgi:predicted amidophosphoribosyltransferase
VVCLVCHVFASGELCAPCRAALRPPPERILAGGVRAVSAFEHTGAAAQLIHALKYRGHDLIVRLAVDVLSEKLGPGLVYVPVPRVWTRYLRYGVDPSQLLAGRLARATRGASLDALRRPVHNPRLAGAARRGVPPAFSLQKRFRGSVALVDDVLTTGSTAVSAIEAIGRQHVTLVVTATSARQTARKT